MKHQPKVMVLDGIVMGGPDGHLWEAQAPRWWQFWRWIRLCWPFDKGERGKVEVTCKMAGEEAKSVMVRVRRYRDKRTGKQVVLPRVPTVKATGVFGNNDE